MFPGFLLEIIVVLLIVGLLLWALSQFPVDPAIARVIRVVVIVMVCIWLIYVLFGAFGPATGQPVFRRP